MRVFVTGGRGFLGRAVVHELAGRHQVLNLSRSADRETQLEGVESVIGDLARPETWESRLRKFSAECCLHLAWEGLPDYSWASCRRNVDHTLLLTQTLLQLGIRQLVVAGSCWEYGKGEGLQSEERIPGALSIFGAAKRALHLMIGSLAEVEGLQCRWARIFFAYGSGQRDTSLIPTLWRQVLEGRKLAVREPGSIQDFIHVEDVAQGMVMLLQPHVPAGAYNLGTGTPALSGTVANLVADHYGLPAPYPSAQAETSGMWADTHKTLQEVGWSSQISLREGVKRTLRELDERPRNKPSVLVP